MWDNLGWLEVVFFGTVALGFGFYQLWSVNREIAKDKEKAAAKDAAKAGEQAD
ncbi:hypothetical protein ACRAQ7_08245 [Erythrobacter sp. W53]|uniref:hypothetical protein n=1 Tax=Erythrobacter sp. W53 TaxID=3425947 RepID=UPI003D76718E